jgi:2-phospho-L-lactate/phosphoenolpyruvate guanylyltransferase
MMYAAVPVKTLRTAKSRLAAALSAPERAGLAEDMLRGVLRAITDSGVVAASAVVSPDPRALAIGVAAGAAALRQGSGDLNAALELARGWAVAGGADMLLVLLGDLPLLRASDINAMAEIAADSVHGDPVVVMAPDRHGRGTNALLLRPPRALPFYFGADSYARHTRAAEAAGAELMIYRSPGTSFDLDTPADLADLRGAPGPAPGGAQPLRGRAARPAPSA